MTATASSDRSVLVTGGAGFVGRRVLDVLSPYRTVRVLDRFRTSDPDELPTDVETIAADVRDREALARASADVNVIVHLARPTPDVEGTRAVLERATEIDSHVVLASSAAVYGEPSSVPTPESADLAPLSKYGDRKYRAEQAVQSFRETRGLSATVLRYFNVYGPRRDGTYGGLPGRFLDQAIDEGAVEVTGDGSQTRDFVHVRDVARATVSAAENRPNATINVGTGTGIPVASVARWIATITDARVASAPRPESDPDRSVAATGRMQRLLEVTPRYSLESNVRSPSDRTPTDRRELPS